MAHLHIYKTTTTWTGNRGSGTNDYTTYDRSHTIDIADKSTLLGSSDPAFRGDKSKHNPEDLLVAAVSACHMLWYLHLCAVNGVVVTSYVDEASGEMELVRNGSGQFRSITLKPSVTVTDISMIEKANELHGEANKMCFIARSLNFPVHHQPKATAARESDAMV